jgi:hypothetical protein
MVRELDGFGALHAAFLTESRTRSPLQHSVQEIRVAPLDSVLGFSQTLKPVPFQDPEFFRGLRSLKYRDRAEFVWT